MDVVMVDGKLAGRHPVVMIPYCIFKQMCYDTHSNISEMVQNLCRFRQNSQTDSEVKYDERKV